MSGATGRLWVTNDGRGRLELQSDAGDVADRLERHARSPSTTPRRTPSTRADLPQQQAIRRTPARDAADARRDHDVPRPSSASTGRVSGRRADRTSPASRPTRVTVSPKHDGGLLGSARARLGRRARRAAARRDLRAGRVVAGARARRRPTSRSAPVPTRDVARRAAGRREGRRPRARRRTAPAATDGTRRRSTGLAAVQAAAGFPVVAPDTLVGLPRQDVRLVGGRLAAALVVYGQGLGAIVVVERKADAPAQRGRRARRACRRSRSTASTGARARDAARHGPRAGSAAASRYVLAGSVPPAAAEAAARGASK